MDQPRSTYIYRIINIPELRNLKVEIRTEGEKLRSRVAGVSSPLIRCFIKYYISSHNPLGILGRHNEGNVYSLYFPPVPSPAHGRMFESLISTLIFKRPLPLAATIGITDRCQYACRHCSAAGRDPDRPVMTTDEILKVVDQCLELGVSNITFTGGEPLLHNDLAEIISHVPPEKAVTQFFTNAAELTADKVAELKAAGLYGLQISLDDADPGAHDRLRGFEGAFAAVKRGFTEARRAGLLVGLSTYATRDRLQNGLLPRLAELASSWGARELTVFDAIETGNMRGEKELLLDYSSRRRIIKETKVINRKHRGRFRLIPQTWTNSRKGFSRFIGCLAAKFQVHITAQGDLIPCDFTPLSFGNIRECSVKELWQKLISHPAYCRQVHHCRMQDPGFRKTYIETIPENAYLPYRIDL